MKFDKKLLYLCVIFALILSMNYKKFGELGHEILGVILVFFAVFHSLKKRKNLTKFKGRNLLNFALIFAFLTAFASAVFLSEYIFSFIDFGFGSDEAKNIHMFSTHLLFLLASVHLGLNFKFFKFSLNFANSKFLNLTKYCLFIVILGFGIYSFIDLHFYEYLFFKTGFGLENKNSFLFSTCEYFAIFLAIVISARALNLRAKF